MTYKIILENRAITDSKTAYNYYELIQVGLGDRFMRALEGRINSIRLNPKLFRKIKDEIRQVSLKKFPFVIIYEIFEDIVIVYAIFHTSRNPDSKFTDGE